MTAATAATAATTTTTYTEILEDGTEVTYSAPPSPRRSPETAESFMRRVQRRTGLCVRDIPDAQVEKVYLVGERIMRSPHGEVWGLDQYGEDKRGCALYAHVVMLNRGEELPLAATGWTEILEDGREVNFPRPITGEVRKPKSEGLRRDQRRHRRAKKAKRGY